MGYADGFRIANSTTTNLHGNSTNFIYTYPYCLTLHIANPCLPVCPPFDGALECSDYAQMDYCICAGQG